MPERNKRNKVDDDIELSDETEQRIDQLPEHAQDIFLKVHANALKEQEDPKKRRGSAKEEVAYKVAWAAVKKDYKKKGEEWIKKQTPDAIVIMNFFYKYPSNEILKRLVLVPQISI